MEFTNDKLIMSIFTKVIEFYMNQPDKPATCGYCNYCTGKCGCPECNGYSCYGSGCGGCRNHDEITSSDRSASICAPTIRPPTIHHPTIHPTTPETIPDPTIPAPLIKHLEPEIFIPDGGPEGVGVEPIPDCRWEACGGTRDPTTTDHVHLPPFDEGILEFVMRKNKTVLPRLNQVIPAPLTRHLEPEIIIHDSGEEGRGVDP